VLLLLDATACIRNVTEQGVLRTISADASRLTIDEGHYRPAPTLLINNLGRVLNEL
jgi:hypothetical protein